MKTQILSQILSIVSEVCEVKGEEILSRSKRADVVDARNIFVFNCSKYGFQHATIADFIHRKRICTVRDCISNHLNYSRQSAAYRLLCAEVAKKLAEMFQSTER